MQCKLPACACTVSTGTAAGAEHRMGEPRARPRRDPPREHRAQAGHAYAVATPALSCCPSTGQGSLVILEVGVCLVGGEM